MAIMGSGAGGSGAGGSGAGGSGAGGSGAGGSGAGGSGAGGSGAGAHAGGPGTPLLNIGLTVTHDAVIGYWAGDVDLVPAGAPKGFGEMRYLTAERRMTMLTAELLSRFNVAPALATEGDMTPTGGALHFDGEPVCKIAIPDRDTVFKEQVIWLRNYADLRADRIPEINTQAADILSYMGSVARLDAAGRQSTLELLTVVQNIAYALSLQMKHFCWAPRPIDYSARIHPVIQTPDHSSFPSGHATVSFALATVLHRLMNPGVSLRTGILGGTEKDPAVIMRIAHRISANRTVAGVHFPVDSAAGALLGCVIGDAISAILQKATSETEIDAFQADFEASANSQQFAPTQDFLLSSFPIPNWEALTPHRISHAGPLAAIYSRVLDQEWGSA